MCIDLLRHKLCLLLELSEALWQFMPTVIFLVARMLIVYHRVTILLHHLPGLTNHLIGHCITLHKLLVILYRLQHLRKSTLSQISLKLSHILWVLQINVVHIIIRNAFLQLSIILQGIVILPLHTVTHWLLHCKRFPIFIYKFLRIFVILRFFHTLNWRKTFQRSIDLVSFKNFQKIIPFILSHRVIIAVIIRLIEIISDFMDGLLDPEHEVNHFARLVLGPVIVLFVLDEIIKE